MVEPDHSSKSKSLLIHFDNLILAENSDSLSFFNVNTNTGNVIKKKKDSSKTSDIQLHSYLLQSKCKMNNRVNIEHIPESFHLCILTNIIMILKEY